MNNLEDLYNQALKDFDELDEKRNKAIKELFELKDMIYKPETRNENLKIQRKISKIIINLGERK